MAAAAAALPNAHVLARNLPDKSDERASEGGRGRQREGDDAMCFYNDHGVGSWREREGEEEGEQDRQYLHKARKADSQATRKAAAVSCVFSKPFSCHGLENRRSVLLGSLPTLVWLIFTSVFLLGKKLF